VLSAAHLTPTREESSPTDQRALRHWAVFRRDTKGWLRPFAIAQVQVVRNLCRTLQVSYTKVTTILVWSTALIRRALVLEQLVFHAVDSLGRDGDACSCQ
jgi:hypothetical protein